MAALMKADPFFAMATSISLPGWYAGGDDVSEDPLTLCMNDATTEEDYQLCIAAHENVDNAVGRE